MMRCTLAACALGLAGLVLVVSSASSLATRARAGDVDFTASFPLDECDFDADGANRYFSLEPTRQQIEDHLYDERGFPMSNAVDRIVCTLRRKIDAEADAKLLQTRRGFGYVLGTRG